MDIVISAATQRSGSTMLQRIFNAREKTLIWGENGGCLTDFCRIYNNANHFAGLKHRSAYFNNGGDANKWIAGMTPPKNEVADAMVKTVRAFHENLYVKNYSKQHDFIGYKEVRYGKKELRLLRQCYPNCTVILLVRNPIDVWSSLSAKGWKELYSSLEEFTKLWNQHVETYFELSKTDSNMYLVKYEDITSLDKETINLIKQIGHLEEQDIQKVLAKRINSSSTSLSKVIKQFIIDQCSPLMTKMGYVDDV
ncbi:hypothetical protein D4T97_005975 [Siminovitchia acidinfaciens]|uniref:Sulfotransferase n=1 Tax=Siminovitchia acidinfaciens TaxID=2321395 RepID=A0A429Y4K5_9BACI|nr:sulfotransferase [Siminovitchia acidinfaciens]RST76318.1 hypothetical protein D4T97_005975 [Siminovitchia acidinfaciens]